MIALSIPKNELITMIELLKHDPVTSVDLTEMMEKYGDLLVNEKVQKVNEKRAELYA